MPGSEAAGAGAAVLPGDKEGERVPGSKAAGTGDQGGGQWSFPIDFDVQATDGQGGSSSTWQPLKQLPLSDSLEESLDRLGKGKWLRSDIIRLVVQQWWRTFTTNNEAACSKYMLVDFDTLNTFVGAQGSISAANAFCRRVQEYYGRDFISEVTSSDLKAIIFIVHNGAAHFQVIILDNPTSQEQAKLYFLDSLWKPKGKQQTGDCIDAYQTSDPSMTEEEGFATKDETCLLTPTTEKQIRGIWQLWYWAWIKSDKAFDSAIDPSSHKFRQERIKILLVLLQLNYTDCGVLGIYHLAKAVLARERLGDKWRDDFKHNPPVHEVVTKIRAQGRMVVTRTDALTPAAAAGGLSKASEPRADGKTSTSRAEDASLSVMSVSGVSEKEVPTDDATSPRNKRQKS